MSKFTVAELLLASITEYNGHLQSSVDEITLVDAMQLLEDLYDCEDKYLFALQLFSDSSASIVQIGYWDKGEQVNGDHDRMIVSFERVVGGGL